MESTLYGRIIGPLRWAQCVDGLVGPWGCHLSENIKRKVAFENGHFFTDGGTLFVESTLYGRIIGPLRWAECGDGLVGP